MPTRRTDRADLAIAASPDAIFAAFDRHALMQWLPPRGMTGRVLEYDFREGGRYRYELSYAEGNAGKTTSRTDVTRGQFVAIEQNRRIVQTVEFESDDPSLAGVMTMTWGFDREGSGTRVSVVAEDVPPAIRKEDHDVGLRGSLDNLKRFVKG